MNVFKKDQSTFSVSTIPMLVHFLLWRAELRYATVMEGMKVYVTSAGIQ